MKTPSSTRRLIPKKRQKRPPKMSLCWNMHHKFRTCLSCCIREDQEGRSGIGQQKHHTHTHTHTHSHTYTHTHTHTHTHNNKLMAVGSCAKCPPILTYFTSLSLSIWSGFHDLINLSNRKTCELLSEVGRSHCTISFYCTTIFPV